MHSPLEIAKNFVEIGLHKVRLSAFKMLVLGILPAFISALRESHQRQPQQR